MNTLNTCLFLILIVLLLAGFWGERVVDFFSTSSWGEFLPELLATIVGVLIGIPFGLWINRKLEEERLMLEVVGPLHIIFAELQYNIGAIEMIAESIEKRPSLARRTTLKADQVIKRSKKEREFISNYIGQLSDQDYSSILISLSKVVNINKNLFYDIITAYRRMRQVKFAIQLEILGEEIENLLKLPEKEKKKLIRDLDGQFNLEIKSLLELKTKLESIISLIEKEHAFSSSKTK